MNNKIRNKIKHTIQNIILKFKTKRYISRLRLKELLSIRNITGFFLSFASIVVSVVGIIIANNTHKVAEKELEILENDREAQFSVISFSTAAYDDSNDFGSIEKYVVYNNGGRITGGKLEPFSCLYVTLKNDHIKGEIYRIMLSKYCFAEEGIYNKETKTFKFNFKSGYQYDIFINKLDSALSSLLPNVLIDIIRIDFIRIQYYNYLNDYQEVMFIPSGYVLESVSEDELSYDFTIGQISNYDEADAKYLADNIFNDFYKSKS